MKISGKTDIGRQRRTNQDSYAAGELAGSVAWAVVCDGMGGANGGNIASATAVKTVSERISSTFRQGMGSNSICNLLKSSVAAANINVFDMSKSVESLSGMGTTIVATVISEGIAHIVHAGDSRAYLISKEGKFEQITRDHSIVQTLLESGQLSEEDARIHPRKNVITRALGVDEILDLDYSEVDLDDGEGILICTDGLTNFVDKDEIIKTLKEHSLMECPEILVDLANENGGGDNITVVVIQK